VVNRTEATARPRRGGRADCRRSRIRTTKASSPRLLTATDVIFTGLIDAHVAISKAGPDELEGTPTCSSSALAAGGVTFVSSNMPRKHPSATV